MRRILIATILVCLGGVVFGQTSFPRSQKDDKDNTMSEAYWKIWNPKVQAKIDADIEANRKADAVINLGDVSQFNHARLSSDHLFLAFAFW